jgi:hypothetical protein
MGSSEKRINGLISLDELAWELERRFERVEFTEAWADFELDGKSLDYLHAPYNTYYRAIHLYGKLFADKTYRFCDLGTWWGLSACAAFGAFREIDTFEIKEEQIINPERLSELCNLSLFKEPEECLELDYSQYDLIFVDISAEEPYKDGELELMLHTTIKRSNFNGIVMYDDIDLSEGTREFWNQIATPKLSLPHWHNSAAHDPTLRPGFGLVDCRRPYYGKSI